MIFYLQIRGGMKGSKLVFDYIEGSYYSCRKACLKAEEAIISPKTEDNIIKELLKLPNLLLKNIIRFIC